jgi:hypothetical protein
MTSDDETSGCERSGSITRRKLLGAAAASTTFFGAGCLEGVNGDKGNQTVAPPPGQTDTATETTPSNDTITSEEETIETATDEQNASETEQTTTEPEDTFQVENPNYFGWEEDSLTETTGFCYLEEGYLGAMDADEVEAALEEEHLYGEDPNNALNDGEMIGSVDPLKPVGGAYAVDVDARHGDEIQYYVQLVGEQDGGVYLNRQGAYELSELEWQEVFNEC